MMRTPVEVETGLPPGLPTNLAEEVRGLGAFLDYFPTSVGAWRYVAPIAFLLLGLLFLGVPLSALKEGAGAAALAFLLGPAFFFVVAVGVYLYLRRLRRMRAWLFADGLVAQTASQTVAWRWDQLALVWQKIVQQLGGGGSALEGALSGALEAATTPTGGWRVLTLQSREGTQIRLAGLRHAHRLIEAIARETLPWLLPPARAQYDSGATVFFGRLGLSDEGIHDGAAVLPWGEVQDVKQADTSVVIARKGKWLAWSKVPLGKIPNVHVFFALVGEVQSRE